MNNIHWTHFNWADYTIVGLLVFSTLVSLIRGFVREAISLAVWIGAFVVAYHFANPVSARFVNIIKTPSLRYVIVFFALFFAILIIGAIVNYFISQLVYKTGLSGTDRLLGLVFGIARGVLLIGILLLLAEFTAIPKSEWWQESELVPKFEGLVVWLKQILPEQFTNLDSMLQKTTSPKINKLQNANE